MFSFERRRRLFSSPPFLVVIAFVGAAVGFAVAVGIAALFA